eukprot:411266_1
MLSGAPRWFLLYVFVNFCLINLANSTQPTTQELVPIVSRMLNDFVIQNDQKALPQKFKENMPQEFQAWYALGIPQIGLIPYLDRMRRYLGCSATSWITSLVYTDRLLAKHSSWMILNSYTVHRLVLTALCVAAKENDDFFFGNHYFADVGAQVPIFVFFSVCLY